jgi:hypothetical protein
VCTCDHLWLKSSLHHRRHEEKLQSQMHTNDSGPPPNQ